ncbi:MAG: iron-sulfur cluster assembly accessory protein [gamma proteobacterium symbiont of Bathyaustriella thionipta]|nr:iron-sulfur cluster assembly accessory protein [gamma proteobacterium symbiont of Bathyaustriella thionipta]
MFKVTANAATQVRKAAEQGGMTGLALRLATASTAQGEIDYRMGFDEVSEEDIQFSSEGIEVIMAPEDVPVLDDITLDFVQLDDGDFQFVFLNND